MRSSASLVVFALVLYAGFVSGCQQQANSQVTNPSSEGKTLEEFFQVTSVSPRSGNVPLGTTYDIRTEFTGPTMEGGYVSAWALVPDKGRDYLTGCGGGVGNGTVWSGLVGSMVPGPDKPWAKGVTVRVILVGLGIAPSDFERMTRPCVLWNPDGSVAWGAVRYQKEIASWTIQ